MSTFDTIIWLIVVVAAACFVLGLHLMNSPVTARQGNQLSAAGMAAAVAATFAAVVHSGTVTATGWAVLLAGILVGSAAGLYSARTVRMTAMPQLVSMFNAVGGGAACIVAIHDFVRLATAAGATGVPEQVAVATALDVVIGAPVSFPGARPVNAALAVVMLGGGAYMMTGVASVPILIVVMLAALGFGVTMVL